MTGQEAADYDGGMASPIPSLSFSGVSPLAPSRENPRPSAAGPSAPAGPAKPVDHFEPGPATRPLRWEYPTGLTSGVFLSSGKDPHPVELLTQAPKAFPGSRTFLYYKSIGADPKSLPDAYFQQARAADILPQIGFESGKLELKDLRGALEGKGTLPEKSAQGVPLDHNVALNTTYRQLVAWADHLKGQGPVIFRPLSEMNDATGAWEMGRPENTPRDFAAVWNEMHDLFDARGATNLRWSFDVAALKSETTAQKVRQALVQIPAKNIDNVGMNPYAMPVNGKLESFASLVDPWLKLFKETGHGAARPVIPEMGVTNNPKGHNVPGNHDPLLLKPGTPAYEKMDAERAKWIHDAFAYARAKNFASVTYFTQMDTHWRVDPGSLAFRALQKEIAAR